MSFEHYAEKAGFESWEDKDTPDTCSVELCILGITEQLTYFAK